MLKARITSLQDDNQFLLNVAEGDFSRISGIHKFALNPDVDSGTVPECIWAAGGTYTYSSSAETWYLMSTNNSDTITVTVEGLDANWNQVTQSVVLTGQTPKAIPTPLIRLHVAYNDGAVAQLGDIYVSRSNVAIAGVPNVASDIRGKMLATMGTTAVGNYSVPAGHTAYLFHVRYESSTSSTQFTLRTRKFGKTFITKSLTFGADTSPVIVDWSVPLVLPAKSDIECRVEVSVNNNVTVSCHFDLILVRNLT